MTRWRKLQMEIMKKIENDITKRLICFKFSGSFVRYIETCSVFAVIVVSKVWRSLTRKLNNIISKTKIRIINSVWNNWNKL